MRRRNFIQWLFGAVTALWAGGFAYLTAKFLKLPESLPSLESNLVRIGPLSELQPGTPRFFAHASHPFWVMRLPSNEVVAVSAICTHYRCILKWNNNAQTYECPCHRGAFDQFGNVLAGPPPSALPRPHVEIRREEVYVHLA
jgi:nitrite reductase/ring-hydroxylating ferredoxin subunit